MALTEEKIEAIIAVNKTENGKALSFQEKESVAQAMVSGNVGKLKTDQAREALIEALVGMGVTSEFLADKIKAGLEAEEKKYFQHAGLVQS